VRFSAFFLFSLGFKVIFYFIYSVFLFKSITWLICFFFGTCIAFLGVKKGFLWGLVLNIIGQGANKSDYHCRWLVELIWCIKLASLFQISYNSDQYFRRHLRRRNETKISCNRLWNGGFAFYWNLLDL